MKQSVTEIRVVESGECNFFFNYSDMDKVLRFQNTELKITDDTTKILQLMRDEESLNLLSLISEYLKREVSYLLPNTRRYGGRSRINKCVLNIWYCSVQKVTIDQNHPVIQVKIYYLDQVDESKIFNVSDKNNSIMLARSVNYDLVNFSFPQTHDFTEPGRTLFNALMTLSTFQHTTL